MQEFFSMSGYGGYVWSAFALTAMVLVLNVHAARRRHRAISERLRRRLAAMRELS